MSRTFLKMNGLGNDFVVVQTLTQSFDPTPEEIRAIAKRGDGGIGCDQVIAIDPPKAEGASAYVRFWNSDGEETGACGNGTRCVAWLLMQSAGKTEVAFDTVAGRLSGVAAGEKRVTVDMGPPRLEWNQIPLAEEMDTARVELQVGGSIRRSASRWAIRTSSSSSMLRSATRSPRRRAAWSSTTRCSRKASMSASPMSRAATTSG